MAQITATPLVKQYEEMKKKHPDAILLFRIGDFYETFGDDAIAASEVCGITLTRRPNGNSKSIELAGFPHDALDTYLPKLVRAGKRVAICEQLGDPKVTKKLVKRDITQGEDQPKQDEPTAPTVREINCIRTIEELRDLGEPVAYFSISIPKTAKGIGRHTSEDGRYPILANVIVEPANGKMIASDTHIMYIVDVECDGIWPAEKDGRAFRCYLDPKAISHIAGKTAYVAVWEDGNAIVTGCEADGIRSQTSTQNKFFNWRRVIPGYSQAQIMIAEESLKPLRDFMKQNMGKTKKERERRSVAIHTEHGSNVMKVNIVENRGSYDSALIAEHEVILVEDPRWYVRMVFRADLLYYSIQEDFNGAICLTSASQPAKFLGTLRESLLMPMYDGSGSSYVTDDYSKTK